VVEEPQEDNRVIVSVAKVPLKANLQVTDSAHLFFAVLTVVFVITYATCQELYFQLFISLEGHSASESRKDVRFAPEGNHP
jgi:hypothetical protein